MDSKCYNGNMVNKKLLNLLRDKNIVKYGSFKLRSGEVSSYYCDIKEGVGNPEILNQIVKEISKIIPKKTTCISASGYGGIAIAGAVAYKTKLPLSLVRDKVKDHGTKKIIDGYVPTNKDYVCIVDDVFTTGSSIKDTKEKLLKTKCKFVKSVVVLNRGKKGLVLSVLDEKDIVTK